MKISREQRRETSNNLNNPDKNVCALAVAKFFRVEDNVRYLHTVCDLQRAMRSSSEFHMRSRNSGIKGKTIGAVRKKLFDKIGAYYYIAVVERHVLVLDHEGNTLIDTDPRKRDARKIVKFFGVFRRQQVSVFSNEIKHIKEFTIVKGS